MSSQPPMGGHVAIPQNDISYTNKPPMSSHLPQKASIPVSQGWLLIAGSEMSYFQLRDRVFKFLAPAVTVGETEGAMDSTSVFFLPLLLTITL